MHRRLICALSSTFLLGVAAAAPAAVTVYDNTANALAAGELNAGSSGGVSSMAADDITPVGGHVGETVTDVTVGIFSNNDHAVTFNVGFYFYAADGAGGNPGTLLGSANVESETLVANDSVAMAINNPSGYFNLPAGTFWAGIVFSGATDQELDNLGLIAADPPTVGSSDAGTAFNTSAPGAGQDNPDGFIFNTGTTPANYYFSFATTPVPEPAALGLAALSVTLLTRRRKSV